MKRKGLQRLIYILAIFALVISLISPAAFAQELDVRAKRDLNIEARQAAMEKLVRHQLDVLNTGKVLHESLEDVADQEWVEVIVQLSEDPVALAKGKKRITWKSIYRCR